MADESEIEDKFWRALEDSPFLMLGVEGAREGAMQPMTARFEDQDRTGWVWIFTAKDHDLTRAIGQYNRAIAVLEQGPRRLRKSARPLHRQRAGCNIDRLWNPIVAEWYEGKDDPKMALLRFEHRGRQDLGQQPRWIPQARDQQAVRP